MNLIGLLGAHGGVGVTTVTVQLTAALRQQGLPVLAVDLSPSNDLRLHFGMELADPSGLGPAVLQGENWGRAAYRSMEDLDFVPFGNLSRAQWLALEAQTAQEPAWFVQQLERLELPQELWILCDCGQGLMEFQSALLQAATQVLVVLNSDAQSFVRLRTETLLAGGPQPQNIRLVLNRYDAARELDQDLLGMLRSSYSDQLLPMVIHRDEQVREALASKRTLFGYAASSQAALDFAQTANWLSAWLLRSRRAA